MSQAFVKEDSGGRWEAPSALKTYQAVWVGAAGREVLRESDDLLDLLRWVGNRPQGHFEVRTRSGQLLAEWQRAA